MCAANLELIVDQVRYFRAQWIGCTTNPLNAVMNKMPMSDSSRSNPIPIEIYGWEAGTQTFRPTTIGGFMTTLSGHTSAIRAKKVIGTEVKDTSGNTIGKIEDIMLDKQSSNIMYAVVGFGGFLGMGEKYHPVPWSKLDYKQDDGAYVVPYTKDQLKAAPADSLDALTRDDGMAYRNRAYEYYKVKPYWQ